jgi:hypothetical protein
MRESLAARIISLGRVKSSLGEDVSSGRLKRW